MRIVLIGQEEPVYFGPFFRKIIEEKSSHIVCVVLIGQRGIGAHPKTAWEKIKHLYCLWLLFEPVGFLKNLFFTSWANILTIVGLRGSWFDRRSIQAAAKKKRIPILFTDDLHAPEVLDSLKAYAPDVMINQSECILRDSLLDIPTIGILNRHASLLPRFRGRVGSFWAHAETTPEYGVTIHFVDREIDSGPILLQEAYPLDSSLSYTKILGELFRLSVPLMLQALKKLESQTFSCLPNLYQGTPTYKFPTLRQIQEYRKRLKERRKLHKSHYLW